MDASVALGSGPEVALRQLAVADIMTRSVLTFTPQTTIEQAARLLNDRRIGGAPVLDGPRVVGVVSKSDLIDLIGDGSAPIERVMTPVLRAVRPTDPALAAVRLMVNDRIHRALVMQDGRLVGIVTPLDVLRVVARGGAEALAPRGASEWHADPASAIYVDVRATWEP
ncbi:MAG: CBS domain-containing protein [Polyangiaceae bacterium]